MAAGGQVDNASVMAGVDFLPTVCAIANVKLPEGMRLDGQDRSAVLRGTPTPRTTPLMWEWRFSVFNHIWNRSPILSIRDGEYKLLFNPDGSRTELYDIPRDPYESENLALQRPEVVRKLRETALAWQKTLPEGPIETPEATVVKLADLRG